MSTSNNAFQKGRVMFTMLSKQSASQIGAIRRCCPSCVQPLFLGAQGELRHFSDILASLCKTAILWLCHSSDALLSNGPKGTGASQESPRLPAYSCWVPGVMSSWNKVFVIQHSFMVRPVIPLKNKAGLQA